MCSFSIGDLERGAAVGDLEDVLPEGAKGEQVGFLFRDVLGRYDEDVGVDLVIAWA